MEFLINKQTKSLHKQLIFYSLLNFKIMGLFWLKIYIEFACFKVKVCMKRVDHEAYCFFVVCFDFITKLWNFYEVWWNTFFFVHGSFWLVICGCRVNMKNIKEEFIRVQKFYLFSVNKHHSVFLKCNCHNTSSKFHN